MKRKALLALAMAGALAAAVTTTGISAVFTDDAETGSVTHPEVITSAQRSREADIQLARWSVADASFGCGTFEDTVTTAIGSVGDMEPGTIRRPVSGGLAGWCVKNVGEQAITPNRLSVKAFDIDSDDTACSGDEGQVDPDGPTCSGHGELLKDLDVTMVEVDCADESSIPDAPAGPIDVNLGGGTIRPLTTAIDPGEIRCLVPFYEYAPLTTNDIVAGQSDRVMFRWRFTARVV